MALRTLIPPCNPSPGFSDAPELKILKADFGDGYTQRTANGIQNVRRVVSNVTWNVLARDERDALIAFLTERGGYKPFTYAFPHDAAPTRWTCEEWSDQAISGGFHKVTAAFRQDFGAAS